MTEQSCHAHVRPLAPATVNQPTRPVRGRDLVRYRALMLGLTAAGNANGFPLSFAAFEAGVAAYELYLANHDRRAKP